MLRVGSDGEKNRLYFKLYFILSHSLMELLALSLFFSFSPFSLGTCTLSLLNTLKYLISLISDVYVAAYPLRQFAIWVNSVHVHNEKNACAL